MLRILTIVSILCLALSVAAVAESGPCTEQSIRKTITSKNDDSSAADDLYIFSAAFEKPVVGKGELHKAREQLQTSRSNETHGPWEIDRIVAAPSGDMAYEYGTRKLSYDDKQSGEHRDFTNAYLRVWKDVDGSCKVAAIMYVHEGKH
jgi:ketosteroid isomerase-like protein